MSHLHRQIAAQNHIVGEAELKHPCTPVQPDASAEPAPKRARAKVKAKGKRSRR